MMPPGLRRALGALAGGTALLIGVMVAAGPAEGADGVTTVPGSVHRVSPRAGEGLIAMVRRTCDGDSSTWRKVAVLNGLRAPYVIYRSKAYRVLCR